MRDKRRGNNARDDEADREDDAGRRRDDGDDTDRAHADDRRDESGQESFDDDVADLVDVGSGAGHEIASAQRRQLRSRGRSQLVVEVVTQVVHARQRHLVGGEARQVACEGARDTKEADRGSGDRQVEHRGLLGGACDEPRGGASESDCGAKGGDAEKQREGES